MPQKKQIFKLNILKKLLDDEHGCVSLVPTTRMLALPPFSLNDTKSGILYLLNCMLKKYDRSLGGIVIGYQNVKVLLDENTGIIPMGTAEIEVNISVEFFIFQPKIGNFLEGIINKKSNNHIGCLVHQYFNATILKPEDVEFDNWICKDFNVDDKITFKVKDLDFTTLIPYIEGQVEESFLHKSSLKSNEKNDINNVRTDVQEELSKRLGSEDSNGNLLENTKLKDTHEEKSQISETHINSKLTDSETNKKKEEKKKKKVKNKNEKEQQSNKQQLTENCDNMGFKANEGFDKKKKRKKKEKEDGITELFNFSDHFLKEDDKNSFTLENENSSDFVKPFKEKKEEKKKKKTKANESLNETLKCLPSRDEDDVLSSTQFEPKSKSKMTVSFCSPIPAPSYSTVIQSSPGKTKGVEKEKKKKDKKRSREVDDEVERALKKRIKILSASFSKIYDINAKTQNMMEETHKDEVNKTVNDFNSVQKSSKKSTKKMSKEDKKEMQAEKNLIRTNIDPDKILFTDSEESMSSVKKRLQANGLEAVKKPQVQNKSNVVCNDEITKTKSESDREVSKDSKKKSKRKLESSADQKESIYEKLLEQAKQLIDLKGNSH